MAGKQQNDTTETCYKCQGEKPEGSPYCPLCGAGAPLAKQGKRKVYIIPRKIPYVIAIVAAMGVALGGVGLWIFQTGGNSLLLALGVVLVLFSIILAMRQVQLRVFLRQYAPKDTGAEPVCRFCGQLLAGNTYCAVCGKKSREK